MLKKTLNLILQCVVVVLLAPAFLYAEPDNEKAIFAGGCFWCMQPPFEKLKGVVTVTAGYTDGKGANPSYDNYAERGYVEAIEVVYNPRIISYPELLFVFWRQIDPTDPGGQFVDRGPQYRSAVFYLNNRQKELAEKSKAELDKSGRFAKPIVTEILKASAFYKAEDYHQDYYKKNPIRYKFYRYRSGRDQFLDRTWGKDRYVKYSDEKKH
jgi:peptide methionine sulfoxide reductase msrA/msrB